MNSLLGYLPFAPVVSSYLLIHGSIKNHSTCAFYLCQSKIAFPDKLVAILKPGILQIRFCKGALNYRQ
jgi:hypothetical protein